jgi:hypothetical protein
MPVEDIRIRLLELVLAETSKDPTDHFGCLLDLGEQLGPLQAAGAELVRAIADIAGLTEHGPDVMLEVAAHVQGQIPGRVDDSRQGGPDLILLGKEVQLGRKRRELAQEERTNPERFKSYSESLLFATECDHRSWIEISLAKRLAAELRDSEALESRAA